jgi:dihydroneopterin aldolase
VYGCFGCGKIPECKGFGLINNLSNSLMSEFTIELKQLYFFSFHGVYEEERKVGGEFIVDLLVKYSPGDKKISSISDTINYTTLYEIVKTEMNIPRNLLETIAQAIAENIHLTFPSAKEIEIRIEKKNPPIINFSGRVAVKFKKQF